jgi:hypothetical protein
MEGILKFALPEEENEFDLAVNAMKWALVAWELDQKLRGWLKYGYAEFESVDQTLEVVRKVLGELMEERGLDFYMIE